MARIVVCDRCGERTTDFYIVETHDPHKAPELGSARADAIDAKDLCGSCLSDYRVWVRDGKQDLAAERLQVERNLADIYGHKKEHHKEEH